MYSARLGFIEYVFVHDDEYAKKIVNMDDKEMDMMTAIGKRGLLIPIGAR